MRENARKRSGLIDSDLLVYPRRYDIVMREPFVSFYRESRAMYVEDRSRFLSLAREQPYYRFFIGIPSASAAFSRQYPSATEDELFACKVDGFVAVIDAINRCGYDDSRKIILKYHLCGPARGDVTIGNGCHRLAILRSLYGALLDRESFIVKPVVSRRVRDNTATLISKALLSGEEMLECARPSWSGIL